MRDNNETKSNVKAIEIIGRPMRCSNCVGSPLPNRTARAVEVRPVREGTLLTKDIADYIAE